MDELTKDLNKSEQISFPVTFELKVIIDTALPEEVNKKNLERILTGLAIPFKPMGLRGSKAGNYSSYTYRVTIIDHPLLKALYEQLRDLPGIKFAI